jgi:hypothetical protein
MTTGIKTLSEPVLGHRENRDHSGLRAGPAIDAATMFGIRRGAVLEGFKWDPQVGDVSTLASFPLVLKRSVWRALAVQAELLTEEAAAAEEEISRRPELIGRLGLPARLCRVLAEKATATPSAGRVIRFDFHPTRQGWLISEANSDVPGGFCEASYFTEKIAQHFPTLEPAGNPGNDLCDAVAAVAGASGTVALLSAPGYMEDQQVVAFLGARLNQRGCNAHLAKPEQVCWRNGIAHLHTTWYEGKLDAIVRFYQAEWLARLPESTGWKFLFRNGRTPVANPTLAPISESKRFPLVWDRLSTSLPTWRSLLPESREPWNAPWSRSDEWLLKTAMCNTGDTVSIREQMRAGEWLRTRWQARLIPSKWVAQRRFESAPLSTPDGPRHVCIGIYTVNGRASGAYSRISNKPVIDFAATDAALLLEDDE